MDFKEASDGLFDRVDHEDLAGALGVSIATVRQARLNLEAKAHRRPPEEWRNAIIGLAEERVGHYRKLIDNLKMCPAEDQPGPVNQNRAQEAARPVRPGNKGENEAQRSGSLRLATQNRARGLGSPVSGDR